ARAGRPAHRAFDRVGRRDHRGARAMSDALAPLLDVDRWDRASPGEQDAAIAEVARRLGSAYERRDAERFSARQKRTIHETCPECDGLGGERAAAGTDAEYP